ncbi:hypothetical protein SCLCIDRAFT_587351 [Scleroderma citrinum Foug A]|uniref:Uncharacterized protein n=1 Tax=Scleroderma citrinum Foug A TaxID=1036808 RepID=A0A0C3D7H2_9AGAM|nr:hypothetical protein SCLCIDRAFT_587351 [Scleroderma citrinum Foug A]
MIPRRTALPELTSLTKKTVALFMCSRHTIPYRPVSSDQLIGNRVFIAGAPGDQWCQFCPRNGMKTFRAYRNCYGQMEVLPLAPSRPRIRKLVL